MDGNTILDEIKSEIENIIENDNKKQEKINLINDTIEKLEEISKDENKDKQKYPRFKINLSKDEIKLLEENNKITNIGEKYILNPDIFNSSENLTPLEKLLLGVIWKNGDYKKESHIIQGIFFEGNKPTQLKCINNRYVFWNFGRYLANKENPIVDQHTFRAYKYLNNMDLKILLYQKNDADNEQQTYYELYFNWFAERRNSIVKSLNITEKIDIEDVAYWLDLFLFTFGKNIPQKKENSENT